MMRACYVPFYGCCMKVLLSLNGAQLYVLLGVLQKVNSQNPRLNLEIKKTFASPPAVC